MKVVLLTTARSERPATLVTLKEQLGIVPDDGTEVTVVSWYAPKGPLPVQTALLVGPDVGLSRHARMLAVADPAQPDDATRDEPGSDVSMSSEPTRANKVRLAVRANPTVSRVRGSTKLRKLRNKVAPGALGTRYALACLTARNVREEIDGADVVVALDANTYRAAWLLARQHTRPAFVVGTAAGKRVLSERAATVTS